MLPEVCCALALTEDGETAVRMPREGMPEEKARALFAIKAGVRAGDEKATRAACKEALEGIRALEGELAKAYAGYLLVQQVAEMLQEQSFPQRQIAAQNAVAGRESGAF